MLHLFESLFIIHILITWFLPRFIQYSNFFILDLLICEFVSFLSLEFELARVNYVDVAGPLSLGKWIDITGKLLLFEQGDHLLKLVTTEAAEVRE